MIRHTHERTHRISLLFHSTRIIITVGSLIVPALLSIQGATDVNVQLYWTTWAVSLLVTISNALVALFKFDKRYYYLHTILERLISEGWQYIELTGKYSGYYIQGRTPTHQNQFVYFCHAVEKIRMKQVEDEYYKPDEGHQASQQNSQTSSKTSTLLPPTPQDALIVAPEIVTAVREQLSQQSVENGVEAKTQNKEGKENGSPKSVSVSFDL